MSKTTIDGYGNVKEIGLTEKYEKYAWTQWSREGDEIVVDWGKMISDVVFDYNDGTINGGELMGILTLIGLSAEDRDGE